MDVTKTSCKRDLYCVSCDLGKGVEYHPLLCRMWVVSYSAEERDVDWEFYVEGHGFNGKLGLSAIKHGSEELWS